MGEFRPFGCFIVGACRTASGKRNGRLSGYHPADLGAHCVDALIAATGVDPGAVDDVICGAVSQSGAQAGNLGRGIVLASERLPLGVPGCTVDRQCGSSQQALHFASQAVMSGTADCVIACGVECMSLVPIGSSVRDAAAAGHGKPKSEAQERKWPGIVFSQFDGAELLAQKYEISREEMDDAAVASHRKADAATRAGHFKREIVPLQAKYLQKDGGKNGAEPASASADVLVHDSDEGIRWPASREKIGQLKPLNANGGRITAATSSQIADGASAVLVVNERGLKRLGLRPRARIVSLALAGSDPVIMLEGPIPATQNALARAGLTLADIDLYEVNEAFASVPLAWMKALGADADRLNVNGGAMALGHPLGATGCKLMCTLLHELERRQAKRGLLAICEGGGTSNCTIIELCSTAEGTIIELGIDAGRPTAKL